MNDSLDQYGNVVIGNGDYGAYMVNTNSLDDMGGFSEGFCIGVYGEIDWIVKAGEWVRPENPSQKDLELK